MTVHTRGEVNIISGPNSYYKTIELEKIDKIDFSDSPLPPYLELEDLVEKSGIKEDLGRSNYFNKEVLELMEGIDWVELMDSLVKRDISFDCEKEVEIKIKEKIEEIDWQEAVIKKIKEVLASDDVYTKMLTTI